MIDEALKEFLVESLDGLDLLDRELVALERAPASREMLSSLFRAIHTIKGTAGCLGLSAIESVSHAGENLMSRARDGELVLTPPRITALLAMTDSLRGLLSALSAEEPGGEPGGELQPIIDRLALAATGEPGRPVQATVAPALLPKPAEPESASPPPSSAGDSLRVEVGLLDRLMNLVGELVLARNQILQTRARSGDLALAKSAQRLDQITTLLQESVMKTRMQPIGQLFGKLPRAVRDVAAACGKQARLELWGEDTELDKTLLEAIRDPLMHLVRNAIDHGIETPEGRRAAGKAEEGLVRIDAWHEGGQVNVLVRDDGSGIDPGKLKAKAVAKGFITADAAARLTDKEALGLVFLPGFSTAEKVTNVSGRGVGMDVVRINVERIGGTVDVQSTLGGGTWFKIKVPLTLAIVPALIVGCGGERYAIPQISLLEIVRLEREHEGRIERIRDVQVYRLRGQLLPLVDLRSALGLGPLAERGRLFIVVLQADDKQLGVLVESIEDTVEIVVKPLGRHLRDVQLFAGATILGDGRAALIVDVRALAHGAGVAQAADPARAKPKAAAAAAGEEQFLLCRARDDGRMAIPLGMVARLEEIAATDIERVGGREVIQHRGDILPLVRLSDALPERRTGARSVHELPAAPGLLQIVVHSDGERSVAIAVDSVMDILKATPTARRPSSRPGVEYVAVIGDRVTEVLDLAALRLLPSVAAPAEAA